MAPRAVLADSALNGLQANAWYTDMVSKKGTAPGTGPISQPAILAFYGLPLEQLADLAKTAIGNNKPGFTLVMKIANKHKVGATAARNPKVKWQNALILWFFGVDPPSAASNYLRPSDPKRSDKAVERDSRLAAVGPVVTHQDMFEVAALDPTAMTQPWFGAAKKDRQLNPAEQKRAAVLAFIINPEAPEIWMQPGTTAESRSGRGRSRAGGFDQVFQDQVTKYLDGGGTWEAIVSPVTQAMQDRVPKRSDYVQTELHRRSLPFERYSGVLKEGEGFSAGCTRCMRLFWEPREFYVQDTSRTVRLNTMLDKASKSGANASTEKRDAQEELKRLKLKWTQPGMKEQFAQLTRFVGNEAVERGTVVQIERLGAGDDDWEAGSVLVVARGKAKDLENQEKEARGEDYEDDGEASERKLVVIVKYHNAHPTQTKEMAKFGNQVTRATEAPSTLKLYRWNQPRANSNLCFECGGTLRSLRLKLLDDYDITLPNQLPPGDRVPARRRTFESREANRAEMNARFLKELGWNDERFNEEEEAMRAQIAAPPQGETSRAHETARRHSGQTADSFDPGYNGLDPRTLLRNGKITNEQFIELARGPRRAPNAPLPKVVIDVTVGDLRSGLINPVASKEIALEKHRAVVAQAIALLDGKDAGPLSFELAAALEQLAASHQQRAEQLEHPEAPQLDIDEDPGYEFLRVVKHVKKDWHPGFVVSPLRKDETAVQARSVQQSKFLITLVLHRRATFHEAHNAHVMKQMADACTALMSDAGREHLRRIMRFGLLWGGPEKGWQTWAPKKKGASTTGVGHYAKRPGTPRTEQQYKDALDMNDDPDEKLKFFWNDTTGKPYNLDDLKEGSEAHPYAKAVPGDIFLPDEYATDLFDDVVKSVNSQVGIEVGPVARLFHFHMLLDVKHISKVAIDQRAFIGYFLGCWQGRLFQQTPGKPGDFYIRDQSGYDFVQAWERPYLDIRLMAEDSANIVTEAYVKKQAIGFMNAARRAEASHKPALISHGRATLTQPQLPSSIGGHAQDRFPPQRRRDERYNQPAGTPISSRVHVVSAITGTLTTAAPGPTAPEPITPYEQARLEQIEDNLATMRSLGLVAAAPLPAAATTGNQPS
jgi:hypothetical protein